MSKLWSRGLWLVAIIFFYSSLTYGGMITVATDGSGDHLTIQAGIDAATAGDVVEVADGEYTGEGNRDIDFKGKAITVTGNVADPNLVVINCWVSQEEPHRGFIFDNGEGSDSILEGISIINGHAPNEQYYPDELDLDQLGGAVLCNEASPLIRRCIWTGNISYFNCNNVQITSGSYHLDIPVGNQIRIYHSNNIQVVDSQFKGGVLCNSSDDVMITDCDFVDASLVVDNSSVEVSGCDFIADLSDSNNFGRGAIFNRNNGSLVVRDCLVRDYASVPNRYAAGLTNTYGSAALVENTRFINSWGCAISNGYHAVYSEYDFENGSNDDLSLTVIDCLFEGGKGRRRNPAGGICNHKGTKSTITGSKFIGNSSSQILGEHAGGLLNGQDSDVEVIDCLFSDNSAGMQGGGAMLNNHGSIVKISGCEFIDNIAIDGGIGGILNSRVESVTVTNCTFSGNHSYGMVNGYEGDITVVGSNFVNNSPAGMLNTVGCNPTIEGCTFSSYFPEATFCWGIENENSNPIINNCVFSVRADGYASGMRNRNSNPVVSNSLFVGNYAKIKGEGMSNSESSPKIRNCTFAGNIGGEEGGAIRNVGSYPSILNSIMWDNSPYQISDEFNSHSFVLYCDVEGGWVGDGNVDIDPLFVAAGSFDDNGTPDDVLDDVFVMGDYHLQSQGGRWDESAASWVVDDVTSPCIDAGDMMASIGIEPFPNGGILNMGAYGGTAEASKSYFGAGPCTGIIAGDINGDCVVDLLDFSIMAMHWMEVPAAQ